ncbi:universal stress protein [Gordonia sp. PKS22-38]|uniref:Universal stress protein n=1 Tax=Gordonia prachuapensis TaxID=3115651 RepID=A0ABU7MT90_9ACTN|nr:universal stress protein [Gordonia sp. PKS22-38]
MSHNLPIAVGVDGSPMSLAAVRWAARAAAVHDTSLDLIAASQAPRTPVIDHVVPTSYFRAARERHEHELTQAMRFVEKEAPGVEVRQHFEQKSSRNALLTWAARCATVVVGAPGHGRVAGALTGSVAGTVAAHASCPVAVIREEGTETETDRITVGYDGSVISQRAVEAAADEAFARGSTLAIVSAWDSSTLALHGDEHLPAVDLIANRLGDVADSVKSQMPKLDVTTEVIDGDANDALTDLSQTSDLVVMGSRGRGGFAGLLLGSRVQHVLRTAHCPLLIVH